MCPFPSGGVRACTRMFVHSEKAPFPLCRVASNRVFLFRCKGSDAAQGPSMHACMHAYVCHGYPANVGACAPYLPRRRRSMALLPHSPASSASHASLRFMCPPAIHVRHAPFVAGHRLAPTLPCLSCLTCFPVLHVPTCASHAPRALPQVVALLPHSPEAAANLASMYKV